MLFTKELTRRLQAAGVSGVTTYALHPGVVKTELGRHLDGVYFKGARVLLGVAFRPFLKTPEQGAQTTIHCAIDEQAGNESGLYYRCVQNKDRNH